jgi:hypothetical protein
MPRRWLGGIESGGIGGGMAHRSKAVVKIEKAAASALPYGGAS